MQYRLQSQHGSALPIVLFFSAFALVGVLVFMRTEHTLLQSAVRAPQTTQTQLTARSGVWAVLRQLADTLGADTLGTVNTLDSLFAQDLFDAEEPQATNGSGLLEVEEPWEIQPFLSDSFGECVVSLDVSPIFLTVHSQSTFRDRQRECTAEIGGRVFGLSDTVLYLQSGECPPGARIDGRCCIIPRLPLDYHTRLRVRTSDLETVLQKEQEQVAEIVDSTFDQTSKLVVHSSEDFDALPEIVEGGLFIDGSVRDLDITTTRSYTVLGDLQITGDVRIEGVEFRVSGAIKLFDKAILARASLHAHSEIMIGDNASFSGQAVSLSKIVVYGDAQVLDKSVLLVHSRAARQRITRGRQIPQRHSLFFSDRCQVDATGISLGEPGGIITDEETRCRGILWAEGAACHQGELKGILRANALIDTTTPVTQAQVAPAPPAAQDSSRAPADSSTVLRTLSLGTEAQPPPPAVSRPNVLPGTIGVLEEIDEYTVPFFMGHYAIVRWIDK